MMEFPKIRRIKKMDDELMARCMMPAMEKIIVQLDKLHEQTGIRYTYKNNKHMLYKDKLEWEIK